MPGKIYLYSLLLFITMSQVCLAQHSIVVRGTIHDSASLPISGVGITLTAVSASNDQSFTTTDKDGSFKFEDLKTGDYVLTASLQGLENLTRSFSINDTARSVELGIYKMNVISSSLTTVVVQHQASVTVKNDSVNYAASAFPTFQNATVEDLLKRLPAITVDANGNIKAQGQTIQKIYVDGKEFFFNDPKLASRNLTANMVKEVQVFDEKSETAKFNGIDDGSRIKVINLKLKPEAKKGDFLNLGLAGGTNQRYDADLNYNNFNGNTQFSILGNANNVNVIDKSFTSTIPSGNLGESGNSGIISSKTGGINYRNTQTNKLELNTSYVFNETGIDDNSHSIQKSFLPGSLLISDNSMTSHSETNDHRFNARMVFTLDSLNSLIYTPSFNFKRSAHLSNDGLTDFSQNTQGTTLLDSSEYTNNTSQTENRLFNELIWRKRFKKQGRTLSVLFNNTTSSSEFINFSKIQSWQIDSGFHALESKMINYKNTSNTTSYRSYLSASYTEPIYKSWILELHSSYTYLRETSHRRTYNYDPIDKNYDLLIDSLSSDFENLRTLLRFGSTIQTINDHYNLQVGFTYQPSVQTIDDYMKGYRTSQHFTDLFPSAFFTYKLSKGKSFRISYNGSTNQPTVLQLQNVTDYSTYPYIRKGNPFLKEEFINNLNFAYNSFNSKNFHSLFILLSFSNTSNKISNSIVQHSVEQIIMPVNLNGAYSGNASINWGLPLGFCKGCNLNISSGGSYSRDVDIVNQVKNFTSNVSVDQAIGLVYQDKQHFEWNINAQGSYGNNRYSLLSNESNTYFYYAFSNTLRYRWLSRWDVSTDIHYRGYAGLTSVMDRPIYLVNVSAGYTFLKNNKGEFRLSIHDLLNQNKSFIRITGSNYIEDKETETLKRYSLIRFIYHFSRKL